MSRTISDGRRVTNIAECDTGFAFTAFSGIFPKAGKEGLKGVDRAFLLTTLVNLNMILIHPADDKLRFVSSSMSSALSSSATSATP
jgi:hypothetical protein